MGKPDKPSLAVKAVRLQHGRDLPLPAYQSDGAAGMDLLAAVTRTLVVKPGARVLVPTGLTLEIPRGCEAQVRPRSGLALRHGVTVLNSPGTIDSDYRGEVQVLLVNLGEQSFSVTRGERIAQLVVQRIERVRFSASAKASATRRGAGGFGSTGTAPEPAARGRKRTPARRTR
jgi:dUTP pyrophosphatase